METDSVLCEVRHALLHTVQTISVSHLHIKKLPLLLHERRISAWKLISGWRVQRPAGSIKALRCFPKVEGWADVQNSRRTPCFTCIPRRSNFNISSLPTRISAQIEQVEKRSNIMEIGCCSGGVNTAYGETSAWFCVGYCIFVVINLLFMIFVSWCFSICHPKI